ncbi:DUF1697 domain-containing protein [Luteipulveratus sp. YIM 133132]|uniref:DUF1697 domain-containing protein n=1 Tax=Luteipulveratus flavus TaxID=3031728 RepID=UPI0023B0E00F|nr:DUF1697 domain-containing protein [Luteipulveratus sp. YIM 133132]MDE9367354.1 DUF1697 domain-containing protein [Luteipulveratus sp. YIM 133132]
MPRYVAFLRGINVGGHTVKMPQLRALVADQGYDDVETFIASGNVVLTSRQRAATVESTLTTAFEKELGYAVATFVRTPAQLADIIDADPFAPIEDGHKVQVGFLASEPTAACRKAVEALSNDYDTLRCHGREVYWLTRGGISGTQIKPATFDRAVDASTTFRNLTTVRRLVDKCAKA